MKAILVIDMPDNCYECPLIEERLFDTCSIVDCDASMDERPFGCPLKELPNKMPEENSWFSIDYAEGYNVCRKEIVGEEE